MTALLFAVAIGPLVALPLPGWLRRAAGIDPSLTTLVASLAALGLACLMLRAVLAGATPVAGLAWVPALGVRLALRADLLASWCGLAVTAGAALLVLVLRAIERPTAADYARLLALEGATLGAVFADDLVLLWLCAEFATLASAPSRTVGRAPNGGPAALAAMAGGGLALLAGVLLLGDAVGGFRLGAVLESAALLHSQPLYVPTTMLLLAGPALRLAPWLAHGGRVQAAPALAALALSVYVPLRLAPALGATGSWRVLCAALVAILALVVAARVWRTHRAADVPPSLAEGLATAASTLWMPLLAPSLRLSLVTVALGTAGAAALAVSGTVGARWAALSDAAGSGWLLLAAAAAGAAHAADRARWPLGGLAAAALLVVAALWPPDLAAAQLVAGGIALWSLRKALALPVPRLTVLAALFAGITLAAALATRLRAGPAAELGNPTGGLVAATLLLPLALPLVAAWSLAALRRVNLMRAIAVAAVLAEVAAAAWLLVAVDRGAPLGVALGAAALPLGIHLVADRLAATMLVVASLVAAVAVVDALRSEPQRSGRFHALCQLTLAGIAGCVLDANLLELQVFLELLLLAFGALLRSGAGPAPALRHVALAGAGASGLLLLATGCIYAAAGTVDLATLAIRAPAIATDESPLLQLGGYLLLVALALRAGAVPFGWWLCAAGEVVLPAAGAFAGVLVAVGVYALLRLYTLVYPCFGAGPCGPSGLVLPLGLATLAAAGVGALAARSPAMLRTQLLMIAVGALLAAVGTFREGGFAAAAFGLAPTALGGAALALAGRARGAAAIVALAAALGLPPFPGWVARIALLVAAGPDALVIWLLVLSTALLAAIAVIRAVYGTVQTPEPVTHRPVSVATGVALALLVALTVAAGPAFDFATRTARELLDRHAYVAALSPSSARR